MLRAERADCFVRPFLCPSIPTSALKPPITTDVDPRPFYHLLRHQFKGQGHLCHLKGAG